MHFLNCKQQDEKSKIKIKQYLSVIKFKIKQSELSEKNSGLQETLFWYVSKTFSLTEFAVCDIYLRRSF